MNFLEKNLEDIIFNTPNHLLRDRGLPIYGLKKRQVKIGNYGISDIISISRGDLIEGTNRNYHVDNCVTIYELKQQEINASTLLQAIRYAKGVKRYLAKRDADFDVKICLIGASIEQSSGFVYLADFMYDFLSLYTYRYEFDGISFDNHSDYNLIHEGF